MTTESCFNGVLEHHQPAKGPQGYTQALKARFLSASTISLNRSKVMVSCRKTGSSELTLLAWSSNPIPFEVTDTPNCGRDCFGQIANSVKWYRTTKNTRGGAWGFADGRSRIDLYAADISMDSDGPYGSQDKRLSFYLNDENYSSFRCGTAKFLYDVDNGPQWELVLFHAN